MSEPIVLIADDRGRYVDANEEAVKTLGFSRDELLQLSVWDLTPYARELDGLMLWQAFIRAGRQEGEYILRTKGGALLQCRYEAQANVGNGRHESRLTVIGPAPARTR